MTQSLLRLPSVIERTGYRRSTLYLKIKQGLFPAPIALGPRAVAWPSDAIDAWIATRIAASEHKAPA
jgi:prophage regulatory protein